MKRDAHILIGVMLLAAAPGLSLAQKPAAGDMSDLARKTQNPVGDLLTFPFQFNFNNGGAYGDETMFLLNFQPVLPFALTDDWNVISRTIVPFYSFPDAGTDRATGIGDVQEALYLTPKNPGSLIWGIGPVFSLPTATNALVKTGSWAVGPGAVALTMKGPWVIGGLLNQFWNFSDHGGRPETNLFVLQPFINYNFGKGWALAFAPLLTANWDAPDGQKWNVPLGLGVTRTTVFNGRPWNVSVQYYANVERPDNGPGNQLRLVLAPIYPK